MTGLSHHAEETCPKTKSEKGSSLSLTAPPGRKNDFDEPIDASKPTDPPQNVLDDHFKPGENHHDSKLSESSEAVDDDFPEGGLQAWLVVFGGFSAQFMIFGIINSTGALQDYLSSNQLRDNSPEQIAWIFSVELFLVFFCSIYVGGLFDAHGPRVLVAIGSVALVLSMMMLSLCTEYWHFVLDYSILGGTGGAFLLTPAYGAIGHFFRRRRGLATGISAVSGALGGIIIPIMLQSLILTVGYGWSIRILGFLLLLLAVPANLFIRSRLPPSKEPFRLIPDLTAFKNPSLALCALGIFLMEWALFIALAYISSYVTTNGQGVFFGFTINAILNAGSFFGRWVPGFLADRFGRFNVILATIALCAITILATWLPAGDSQTVIIVFAVMFGFASGSNLGLIPVCLSQLCPIEEYGRYFAAAFTFASFGTLTSVPIGGSLLVVMNGSFTGLIIFAGVAYVGALCCYAASRGLAAGWDPRIIF